MNKKTLMPVIVLVSICVIVAALLGAVNMLTAPKILENAQKKEQEALFEVLDTEKDGFDKLEDLSDLPATVLAVYKAKGGSGYVVSLATTSSYSSGDMAIVVGIDESGNITGVKLNSYYESKDFGKETYPQNYVGKNIGDYNNVALVSGVTYSSAAFRSAIGDAFVAVGIAKGEKVEKPEAPEVSAPEDEPEEVLPRTDSEIKALFEELAKASLTLTDMTPETKSAVKRIYKDEGGKGYFAYVLTSTEWVPVETEGVVYINSDGDIENIKLLTWTVGHGVDYTEEYISSFFNKDIWHGDGITLVSEATRTADNFKQAVLSALKTVTDVMPRTEKKILELAGELVQNEKGFTKLTLPEGTSDTVKAVYEETSGKGYIAYLQTSTQWVARETETLVFIDSFGKIKDIRVLTWTVGHGIDYTEDFVNSFIGKTKEDIGRTKEELHGIELVTGATGTSEHLCYSIADAFDAVPSPKAPVLRIVAIVLTLVLVSSFVFLVIFNRKRRAPYEK